MSTINPNASQEIDKAFAEFTGFQQECCNHLRALIHKALPEVKEDFKWTANFNVNGLVCGVWIFQKHVILNFYKGSMMSDKYNFFHDADEAKDTRAIHFTEHTAIDEAKIMEYLKEAAALNKEEIKTEKKANATDTPEELLRALNKHTGLKMYFDKISLSHRREYTEYIADAKEAETRERRIKKVLEMIVENRKIKEKQELKNKHRKR